MHVHCRKESQQFGVMFWCPSAEICRVDCEWCRDEICRVEPVMVVEKSRDFAKYKVRRCVPRGRSTGRERESTFIFVFLWSLSISQIQSLSFTRARERKTQIYCCYRSSQRCVSAVPQRRREVLPRRGSAASKTAWGASARNSNTLIPQHIDRTTIFVLCVLGHTNVWLSW